MNRNKKTLHEIWHLQYRAQIGNNFGIDDEISGWNEVPALSQMDNRTRPYPAKSKHLSILYNVGPMGRLCKNVK